MKKLAILFLVVGIIGTLSCNDDAYNQDKCLESVQKKYPKDKIYLIPGEKYTFIVQDSTHLYFVKTMDPNSTEVTGSTAAILIQ